MNSFFINLDNLSLFVSNWIFERLPTGTGGNASQCQTLKVRNSDCNLSVFASDGKSVSQLRLLLVVFQVSNLSVQIEPINLKKSRFEDDFEMRFNCNFKLVVIFCIDIFQTTLELWVGLELSRMAVNLI